MKNIRIFYLTIFIFFYGKIFNIFEKACFQVLLVCVCETEILIMASVGALFLI